MKTREKNGEERGKMKGEQRGGERERERGREGEREMYNLGTLFQHICSLGPKRALEEKTSKF